jgi:hypothetical protein
VPTNIVQIDNDSHVRLVEDLVAVAVLPSFEVVAPMTAVKIVKGNVPDIYFHNYSRGHYLALKNYYHERQLADSDSQ